MKRAIWIAWSCLTLALIGYYGLKITLAENKQSLLIGEATHGHYQIEMACTACHTEAFGGEEALQEACVRCHQNELDAAHDSHPKKKFTDPRNADRLAIIDARYCVTCHTEHQAERTQPMGLTIAGDYCFYCHQEIADERESHAGAEFNSCASAGCHNYHDNRALYENFLIEHLDEPWLSETPHRPRPDSAQHTAAQRLAQQPHLQLAPELTATLKQSRHHWEDDVHFDAGVACVACHQANSETDSQWLAKPGMEECQSCHTLEAEGYQQGKHGMRLAQDLPAIRPGQSGLPFHPDSLDKPHGCTACHGAHRFDTQAASVDACLGCHNDRHSQNFKSSPHGQLASLAGSDDVADRDGAVTCATCHMPRVEHQIAGKAYWKVEHNQNLYLRPNEKMIRPVCMHCHGLEFSINALADEQLIENNFRGSPAEQVPSIEWARKANLNP